MAFPSVCRLTSCWRWHGTGWDLEYNKVIRHYHGHLSGVYALALHPTLDVLISAGRDSVARVRTLRPGSVTACLRRSHHCMSVTPQVWDIRTKQSIHVLGGHESTVASVLTNPVDPQVITGSMDHTIRLWDLAAGKTMATLTHHKKSIRAMVSHPRQVRTGIAAGWTQRGSDAPNTVDLMRVLAVYVRVGRQ